MKYLFTDSSPFYGLAVFMMVFAAAMACAKIPSVRLSLALGVGRFGELLRRRGLFTGASTLPGEQRRLDLLRIVVGGLLTWHFCIMLDLATATDVQMAAGVAGGLLAVMICIGLATPLAAALMALLLNLIFDNVLFCSNMPSLFAAAACLIFALAPAGRSFSVDAWLLARSGWRTCGMRSLYNECGALTLNRAAVVKFVAFTTYSALCLAAALNHLLDPSWRSGYTMTYVALLPTSNPSGYQLADKLYQFSPFLFIEGTRLMTYGMIVWEAGLFLLIWNRYTRFCAIVWGLTFLVFTCVWLKLWFMGFFELALWALLFWNRCGLGWLSAQGPTAGAAQVPEEGPPPILIGVWLPPALLTFGVLLAAFLVRLPYTEKCPYVEPLGRFSKSVFGRSWLVFGLGQPDVFNKKDLATHRWGFVVRRQGIPFPAHRLLGQIYLLTLSQGASPIDQEQQGMRSVLSQLLRQMFDDGSGFIEPIDVQCSVIEVPTEADLRAHRYVPVGIPPVELFTHTADSGFDGPFRIKYNQDGLDAWCRARGVPFQIHAATAQMLGRFPVQLEVRRIRFWLDHPNLLESNPDVRAAARQMLEQISYVDRLMDFTQVAQILSMLNLDWTPEHLPHASSQCDADLALAKAYFQTVFDDALRARMRNDYDQAVTAAERGDHMGCLLHTAAIRRAYLETVIRR